MLKLKQRKGSRYWHITGTLRGKRYRESTGTDSRPHAEAILANRQNEILDREVWGEKRTALFAEAVLHYAQTGGETRFLKPLLDRWGADRIEDITAAKVSEAAQALFPGRSAATLDRQLYTPLNAVLRKAAKAELCTLRTFDRPKVRRKPVKIPPNIEVWLEAFLPKANPRLRAIALFMSFTSTRVSEACRLKWHDLDLANATALLGITKNGKPRQVALAPLVCEAILALKRGADDDLVFGYAQRYSVNQAIERACKRANIPYYSSHKIGRHAFAARLLKAGHSIRLVQVAGGWSNIGIVAEHYGHLEQSDVDRAVRDAGTQPSHADFDLEKKIISFRRKA